MIRAVFILLGWELVGEGLRAGLHLPVPGPVIGMLGLAAVLVIRQRGEGGNDEALNRVAGGLIAGLGLLFVPAGVGLITEIALLRAQWLPIVVALFGSTLCGLVVTALVMRTVLPAGRDGDER